MAKRKPGGQPGNQNARGHRGRNAYSPGASRASDRQRAARARSRLNARPSFGQRVRGRIRAEVRIARRNKKQFVKNALVTTAQAAAIATVVTVSVGTRRPS